LLSAVDPALLPGFSRFDFSSLQKAPFQNMEWGFLLDFN